MKAYLSVTLTIAAIAAPIAGIIAFGTNPGPLTLLCLVGSIILNLFAATAGKLIA